MSLFAHASSSSKASVIAVATVGDRSAIIAIELVETNQIATDSLP